MGDFHSFLTGSRAYGVPRIECRESDWDVVILGNEALVKKLEEIDETPRSYPKFFPNSFHFGPLNLIVADEIDFDRWKRGTEALIKRAPVSKKEACEMFDSLGLGKGKCVCSARDLLFKGCTCGGR